MGNFCFTVGLVRDRANSDWKIFRYSATKNEIRGISTLGIQQTVIAKLDLIEQISGSSDLSSRHVMM